MRLMWLLVRLRVLLRRVVVVVTMMWVVQLAMRHWLQVRLMRRRLRLLVRRLACRCCVQDEVRMRQCLLLRMRLAMLEGLCLLRIVWVMT